MKPVRIGVVGLGAFGEKHIKTLSQMAEFEVIAVCSRSADRAKEVAETCGVRRWYTDVQDLAGDPEIEAVDVVTEVARHAEVAKIALLAGRVSGGQGLRGRPEPQRVGYHRHLVGHPGVRERRRGRDRTGLAHPRRGPG